MSGVVPLRPGCYYHIYSRGNNRDRVFVQEENYRYFLRLAAKHLPPVFDVYAYCLLPNHLLFLVQVRSVEVAAGPAADPHAGLRFGSLLNAYAKALNSRYSHTGSVFEHPFGRIRVASTDYMSRLVSYIDRNPQKHGLVSDFRDWQFSSYLALVTDKPTSLARNSVLQWFGGAEALTEAHYLAPAWDDLGELVGPDDGLDPQGLARP